MPVGSRAAADDEDEDEEADSKDSADTAREDDGENAEPAATGEGFTAAGLVMDACDTIALGWSLPIKINKNMSKNTR